VDREQRGRKVPSPGINKLIAAAITTAIGAPIANADATLTETISLSQLLASPGSSYSGTFSIASLLAGDGLTGAQIVSANVTAFGLSDAVFNQTTSGATSSEISGYGYTFITGYNTYYYSCGFAGWSTCQYSVANYGYAEYRTFLDTTTVTNTDTVQDSISLLAGNATGTGAVSNQSPVTSIGPETVSYASNGTYGYDTIDSQTDTVTQGYYGALQASAALGPSDLFSLSSTDTLNFKVTDTLGITNLSGLTLTFTASPVPEADTSLLMVGGLAALAAASRRRRSPSAA
jgi:hypothetical protein